MELNLKREIIKRSKYPHFQDANTTLLDKFELKPWVNENILDEQVIYFKNKLVTDFKRYSAQVKSRNCVESVQDFEKAMNSPYIEYRLHYLWDLRSYCLSNKEKLTEHGFTKLVEDFFDE